MNDDVKDKSLNLTASIGNFTCLLTLLGNSNFGNVAEGTCENAFKALAEMGNVIYRTADEIDEEIRKG